MSHGDALWLAEADRLAAPDEDPDSLAAEEATALPEAEAYDPYAGPLGGFDIDGTPLTTAELYHPPGCDQTSSSGRVS